MPITAEEFKAAAAKRRKTDDAAIEGYGVIRLRSLSALALIAFNHELEKAAGAGESTTALTAKLVAMSWIDDEGKPLFADLDVGAAEAGSMDEEAYAELVNRIYTLNGMRQAAVTEKNSEPSR
jgi:hypothetical protein